MRNSHALPALSPQVGHSLCREATPTLPFSWTDPLLQASARNHFFPETSLMPFAPAPMGCPSLGSSIKPKTVGSLGQVPRWSLFPLWKGQLAHSREEKVHLEKRLPDLP